MTTQATKTITASGPEGKRARNATMNAKLINKLKNGLQIKVTSIFDLKTTFAIEQDLARIANGFFSQEGYMKVDKIQRTSYEKDGKHFDIQLLATAACVSFHTTGTGLEIEDCMVTCGPFYKTAMHYTVRSRITKNVFNIDIIFHEDFDEPGAVE